MAVNLVDISLTNLFAKELGEWEGEEYTAVGGNRSDLLCGANWIRFLVLSYFESTTDFERER